MGGAGNPFPTYSHGGASTSGFPAVAGNVTGSGRPIFIGNSAVTDPCMTIVLPGGTATVVLEANGGILDQSGNPPAGEWVDASGGGYSMTGPQTIAKFIPRSKPYWRTRITAVAGGGVVTSYCDGIRTASGDMQQANYPPISSVQSTS